MRLFVAITLFILAASLTAQVEHAPTVAQCQADQRSWFPQIEEDPNSPSLPTFQVLAKWQLEITDCQKVDPRNKWTYYNTAAEVTTIQAGRALSFIERHDLYKQFLQEDAAGQR